MEQAFPSSAIVALSTSSMPTSAHSSFKERVTRSSASLATNTQAAFPLLKAFMTCFTPVTCGATANVSNVICATPPKPSAPVCDQAVHIISSEKTKVNPYFYWFFHVHASVCVINWESPCRIDIAENNHKKIIHANCFMKNLFTTAGLRRYSAKHNANAMIQG